MKEENEKTVFIKLRMMGNEKPLIKKIHTLDTDIRRIQPKFRDETPSAVPTFKEYVKRFIDRLLPKF